MTKEQFETKLKTLRITKQELAKILGVTQGSVYHWGESCRPVPKYAIAYLELLEQSRNSLPINEVIDDLNTIQSSINQNIINNTQLNDDIRKIIHHIKFGKKHL